MLAKSQPGAADTVIETQLPLPLLSRGKVRDIYELDSQRLLVVTTDRISAFDCILPNPIPFKGKVLNQISAFWFKHFAGQLKHHLLTAEIEEMGLPKKVLAEHGASLKGRSVAVHRAKPLAIECVVRGYITGSGWKDYLKTGKVCGHQLPEGMKQCEKLPKPIFTPATKATEGHDINIDFNEAASMAGSDVTAKVRDLSIELYEKGSAYAAQRGILIADTKFEFGLLGDEIILIDEVLTPDSSRFWPADTYETGHDQPSYDKQIVRNYLLELGWDQKPPAPQLPAAVAEKTSRAYRDIYTRLTNREVI